jgi:hypothetical protein
MRAFACTCGQPLFFHNLHCLSCGADVAYDPTSRTLATIVATAPERWTVADDRRSPAPRFRLCAHRAAESACNWLVPEDRPEALCLSCRLTRTVPALDQPRNAQRLRDLETAKRRVLFVLQVLDLPLVPRDEDADAGLAFDFLESLPGEPSVMTGHAGGVITLNVAEADGDYRELNRESLKEPYRTVIGHLRHELGHYYWDRLIRDTDWLPRYRELFGDERADYGAALAKHYAEGPPPDWPLQHISSYAASHPWEDWAEAFAHYMHARATLGTVDSFGLGIDASTIRVTPFTEDVLYCAEPAPAGANFLAWINAWVVLTAVLNETARSMGQPDLYPFVLNRAVVTKLHFIQCVIEAHAGSTAVAAPPPQLMRRQR